MLESINGYDAWKTSVPDQTVCEECLCDHPSEKACKECACHEKYAEYVACVESVYDDGRECAA